VTKGHRGGISAWWAGGKRRGQERERRKENGIRKGVKRRSPNYASGERCGKDGKIKGKKIGSQQVREKGGQKGCTKAWTQGRKIKGVKIRKEDRDAKGCEIKEVSRGVKAGIKKEKGIKQEQKKKPTTRGIKGRAKKGEVG